MRKGLRFAGLLLGFAAAFMGVSCRGNSSQVGSDLDYESYPDDYAIIVSNMASKNLVLFKNQLATSNIIGAVEKNKTNHYIKKSTLFSSTSDFVLIAITEDDYNSNADNLSRLENKPYARLYAFYNASAKNDTVYKISSSMGGDCKIVIQNTTSYNIELRRNKKDGEVIGYASPESLNTTFSVESGDYTVFPVFIKYIPTKNAIFTFIPTYSDQVSNEALRGMAKFEEFALNTQGDSSYTIEASKFKGNDVTLKTGCAYLTVVNDSSAGLVFMDGGIVRSTTLGENKINKGRSQIYEVSFTQLSNGSYPDERTVTAGVLRVGPSANPLDIPTYTFKSDTMYTLTVTGSTADLTLSNIEEAGAVDWDSL